jgi:hypothetical protein
MNPCFLKKDFIKKKSLGTLYVLRLLGTHTYTKVKKQGRTIRNSCYISSKVEMQREKDRHHGEICEKLNK